MDWFWEHITTARDRSWQWFVDAAHKPHALFWLGVVSFADSIISPIVPEAFIAALMLARPEHMKRYLIVALSCSIAGAAVGYTIAVFLFHQFGEPLLALYGLSTAFETAKSLIAGQVFLAMALASFTPIPDKVFIYAGGFLGAAFVPFILGYALGRGARMAIVAYVVGRFGSNILTVLNRYFLYAALIVLAIFAYYIMVHVHLFGL